jgi:hypothetical protein
MAKGARANKTNKTNKSNKNKKAASDKARIRELTKENMRLRREVESLKGELERGRPSTRRLLRKRDAVESTFSNQARRQDIYAQENAFSYFTRALGNASFFRVYKDILHTVRRLSFVTTTIQIILIILTIIKSSAIFLISTSAFIVALPFIFLFSALGTVLTVIGSRRATMVNRPLVKGKDVYVFLPAKKSAIDPNSFFAGFVKEMADGAPDRVCVIVTQGFFFSRGIGKSRKYYFTSRKEADNIIIVRRHYYYKFKNKILVPEARSVNEIY